MAGMTADELDGRDVVSVRDEKIGTIDGLLREGDDDGPGWARVKTGLLGIGGHVVVPLADAVQDDGHIRLVYEKEHVKRAPDVEFSDGQIDEKTADALHRHYGLERRVGATAPDAEDDIELPRETRDAEPPGMSDGPDNPITKRRLERAKVLGVPSAESGDEDAEGNPADVQSAELPPTKRPGADDKAEDGRAS